MGAGIFVSLPPLPPIFGSASTKPEMGGRLDHHAFVEKRVPEERLSITYTTQWELKRRVPVTDVDEIQLRRSSRALMTNAESLATASPRP